MSVAGTDWQLSDRQMLTESTGKGLGDEGVHVGEAPVDGEEMERMAEVGLILKWMDGD